jgi:hypothetical protein
MYDVYPTTTARFTMFLKALLLLPLAGASELNFDFPYSPDPVPFNASVDPAFIEETLLKVSLYRPSIDLVDYEESDPLQNEGPTRDNMTALATYWKEEYDWYKVQDEIFGNFSHYAITIPGIDEYNHDISFHFVHERSDDEDAVPLLLLHGWPSSHLEWSKVIGPLTSGPGQAFHVVAPDIPGFGFSPAPTHSGLASAQLGIFLDKMMKKLGYEKYGIVTTDLGWFIGLYMADVVSESLIGHYSDFWYIFPNATDLERFEQNETTPEETDYILAFNEVSSKYYSFGPVQSISPKGISQAMSDTPVGFAGWYWTSAHLVSDGWIYTLEETITNAMTLFIQGVYGNVRWYREVFGGVSHPYLPRPSLTHSRTLTEFQLPRYPRELGFLRGPTTP